MSFSKVAVENLMLFLFLFFFSFMKALGIFFLLLGISYTVPRYGLNLDSEADSYTEV